MPVMLSAWTSLIQSGGKGGNVAATELVAPGVRKTMEAMFVAAVTVGVSTTGVVELPTVLFCMRTYKLVALEVGLYQKLRVQVSPLVAEVALEMILPTGERLLLVETYFCVSQGYKIVL